MSYIEILMIITGALFVLLCISVYFNYKHGVLLIKLQDAIESSLDVLDERYLSIGKILDTPVFFDSLEIRQVISDIRRSRDAVLDVANLMTVIDQDNEGNIEKNG